MKKHSRLLIFVMLLGTIFLTGCHQTEQKSEPVSTKHPMKITTTFFPMYDFTKEIVGKYGDVSMIIPSNIEPHDFEPSAKDMAKITNSELFVYNSSLLESWVQSVKHTSGKNTNTVYVEAAKGISTMNYQDQKDPHVWLDPVLAKKEIETISHAIIKKDPKHRNYYEKNTQQLLKELNVLNQEFEQLAETAKQKTFVTQHAAFGYLANQYHFTEISIVGLNDEQEPSPKQLAEVEQQMKEKDLHYIYVEEGISDKLAKTLQESTHATLLHLNPLESVSQKEIDNGATYISLMRENLNALKQSME